MRFFPTTLTTKQAAKLLQTNPDLLNEFENAYQRIAHRIIRIRSKETPKTSPGKTKEFSRKQPQTSVI